MTEDKKYLFDGVEYRAVKEYFSRVNSVFLIESLSNKNQQFILKDFGNNSERIRAELDGIKVFESISPKIYYSDSRYLVHEYIPGATFLSCFEDAEKNDSDPDKLINPFIEFLKSAYDSAPGYILGDINFNNFIIRENSQQNTCTLPISFIDYESVKLGEIEEDIGRIIAFALTYDPVFKDWKYRFVKKFINQSLVILKVSEDKICRYIELEFEAMRTRRKLNIDISELIKRVKTRRSP
jgi:hypothetical protein